MVDGAENNPPSFYLSRHYEVCKYYIIDEHTMIPDILLVSTHLWNRLSAQEQKWLQEALDKSIIDQRRLWTQSENESLQAVIDAGVEVSYPEKAPFQEATKAMYDDFSKDPVIANLIERIRNEKN
ncbi:TRAP transporter substrate-binding protein DctP [Flavobacteriaceae bacterium]|nr:TRAP transporter substrate-binding protein DctP [Flavobacteriaceae bacterium]